MENVQFWYNDQGMLETEPVMYKTEPVMYNRKGRVNPNDYQRVNPNDYQRVNPNDYQWSPSDVYIVPEVILYLLERSAGDIRFVSNIHLHGTMSM